ncbi:hypothetical protein GPA27_20135 [Aromatoleum toluolicum]|uniref:Uncharacterized protein n=1 Tax=Aromatoleum toluolicum TaxID=90060 RepID=A0ABX1NK26_9RHOO|nr:hypothetical protein [Aromatoleum toluolicum]NMF99691.1 hypothetical protein [Aromatoleum toluolicum]
MAGTFLDTTIVVQLAEGIESEPSQTFVAANQPATMAFYALRELLAGRVRLICETHNRVLSSENHAEALLALHSVSPAEGRKKEARLRVLADSLKAVFAENPGGPRNEMKRELLQDLSMRAAQLWRRARRLTGVNAVQPLGCFYGGKLDRGPAGELRGPGDSFNCCKTERCAAAAYLYDDQAALSKLVDALHPSNLGAAAGKNENSQRRKALKELLSNGPTNFNKSRCRALGDAYFAAMCPPGSAVATSNLVDFLPLCEALGKDVKKP